jgi:3-oxoadipate enol-lactonase / 4-carboxymuconolactone decarboxylase
MSEPVVSRVDLGGDSNLPLLVLGPSLGTAVTALWSSTAERLADAFHLVGWDLPGHGGNVQVPDDGFTMAELAAGVLKLVDQVRAERGDSGAPFAYAGDSVGGAVGQVLLLSAPSQVRAAVLLCTSARFGDPDGWHDRAALVRREGTEVMVDSSAARWFSAGFAVREPTVASELLDSLGKADPEGYALTCEALAEFDVRDQLGDIAAPVLVVSGEDDAAAPVADGRLVAEGVRHGRQVVLPGVAHLAPAEAPEQVARLLREHFGRPTDPSVEAGQAVRREVFGDAHVDRAIASTTAFTEDFQDLITRYAWGEIWTRPGLDRRSRSMITLTALIARGHHEELALHVRAARTNGLTDDEIREVILQSAIYCGVPDANTAFRIAQGVLADLDQEDGR